MMNKDFKNPEACEGACLTDRKEVARNRQWDCHIYNMRWSYWAITILGLWLAALPLSISYWSGYAQTPDGRPDWISANIRSWILTFNDIGCGLLLAAIGIGILLSARAGLIWLAAFIGVWLNIAPIVLWAPKAFIYLNETITGILIIVFSIIIPGIPKIAIFDNKPAVHDGWSYNPSAWSQRGILIVLALVCWLISRYLTFFQLGFIKNAWDPFFGFSTGDVLTSKLSSALPISDAGLGAFIYSFELLAGWIGSPDRARAMPWLVTGLFVLILCAAAASFSLVLAQAVIIRHWCTLCLVTAVVMLPMIPLELDEFGAMLQFMVKSKRENRNLWRAFWLGDTGLEFENQKYPQEKSPSVFTGISFAPNLVISLAIGIFLMVLPAIFQISSSAAALDHLGGMLIVGVNVIAMAELARPVRLLNLLFGLVFIIWGGIASEHATSTVINIVGGVIVIILALPRGRIREKYGIWQNFIA